MERELLVNKIQCPDGTILESRYQHDFKQHVQSDGREYFVDGGLSYQRIGYSDEEFINLSVYADDHHEKIREEFIWGRNMDKDGKVLPETEYIKLKYLDNGHVDALVSFTMEHYPIKINKVFRDEQTWRNNNQYTGE
jgi:hypothetical protein